MKNKLALAIVLCAVAAVAGVIITREHQTPASAPQLNTDIYPLYAQTQWDTPRAQEMTLGTTTFAGAEVTAQAVTDTSDIAGVSQPFESYYASRLLNAGWVEDNSLAAGGAGSSVTAYRKGSGLIVLGYQSVFKNMPADEPEQCPCDVELFIFSSGQ